MITAPNLFLYKLLLKLPPDAIRRISERQHAFREEFAYRNAVLKYPHITFAYWTMGQEYEERLFHHLKLITSRVAPQQLRLNGFEKLTKCLCVKVDGADRLVNQIFPDTKIVRNDFRSDLKVHDLNIIRHLHVTIAQDLTMEQLNSVFDSWLPLRFQQDLIVDRLVLLKESVNSKRSTGEFVFSANGPYPGPGPFGDQLPLFRI